jgi:2-polyprenyl-6-methoxyphenol hydroxylase-like FAD-dependent oxidoreductase
MEKQVDVLIIGAGISGIGLAVHLSKNCPQRKFEILERRESLVELGIYSVTLVFVLIRICQLLVLTSSHGQKTKCWQVVLRSRAI